MPALRALLGLPGSRRKHGNRYVRMVPKVWLRSATETVLRRAGIPTIRTYCSDLSGSGQDTLYTWLLCNDDEGSIPNRGVQLTLLVRTHVPKGGNGMLRCCGK